jgi:protein-S-isoprenylcysteine O-methyltransferase Ste14
MAIRSAGSACCCLLSAAHCGWWPVFVLGQRFSGLVEIQPGHTLALSGVYEVIRHPSYLGLLVNLLGWVLAFRSWVGVLLTALLIQPPARAYQRGREIAAIGVRC